MIRLAEEKDIIGLNSLLAQVNKVHHDGRPDLFKLNNKYTDPEILEIINNPTTPIFVYVEDDKVLGHAFLEIEEIVNDNILVENKIVFVHDLCVDSKARGKGVGHKLMEFVKNYAKEINATSVRLNVWDFNEPAKCFYDKEGYTPLKTTMELKVGE